MITALVRFNEHTNTFQLYDQNERTWTVPITVELFTHEMNRMAPKLAPTKPQGPSTEEMVTAWLKANPRPTKPKGKTIERPKPRFEDTDLGFTI